MTQLAGTTDAAFIFNNKHGFAISRRDSPEVGVDFTL
jgi:hypothetical protein